MKTSDSISRNIPGRNEDRLWQHKLHMNIESVIAHNSPSCRQPNCASRSEWVIKYITVMYQKPRQTKEQNTNACRSQCNPGWPPNHCVAEERGQPVDLDLPASSSQVLELQLRDTVSGGKEMFCNWVVVYVAETYDCPEPHILKWLKWWILWYVNFILIKIGILQVLNGI